MRVAVDGSCNYPAFHLVAEHIAALSGESVVFSGDVAAIESAASAAAQTYGLEARVCVARWQRHGKKAGPIRTQQIVNDADTLVAFWDGQSKVPKNSSDFARKKGILASIIPPYETKENAVLPMNALRLQPRKYPQHSHKQIRQIAAC